MAKNETPHRFSGPEAIVTVKGTGDDNKVVIWERDKAHPDGEIFVSNDGKSRQVALTNAVKNRLREGRLEEVEGTKSTTKQPPTPPKPSAPWPGFDEASVEDVVARLANADDATRASVRAYEKANKNRKGVVDALT